MILAVLARRSYRRTLLTWPRRRSRLPCRRSLARSRALSPPSFLRSPCFAPLCRHLCIAHVRWLSNFEYVDSSNDGKGISPSNDGKDTQLLKLLRSCEASSLRKLGCLKSSYLFSYRNAGRARRDTAVRAKTCILPPINQL